MIQLLGCSAAASDKQSGQALLSLQLSEALRDELALIETCHPQSHGLAWFIVILKIKLPFWGVYPPSQTQPPSVWLCVNIPLVPHQNDSVMTRQTQDHPGTQRVSEHVSPFHPLKGGSLKADAASAGKMAIQGPMISL